MTAFPLLVLFRFSLLHVSVPFFPYLPLSLILIPSRLACSKTAEKRDECGALLNEKQAKQVTPTDLYSVHFIRMIIYALLFAKGNTGHVSYTNTLWFLSK